MDDLTHLAFISGGISSINILTSWDISHPSPWEIAPEAYAGERNEEDSDFDTKD